AASSPNVRCRQRHRDNTDIKTLNFSSPWPIPLRRAENKKRAVPEVSLQHRPLSCVTACTLPRCPRPLQQPRLEVDAPAGGDGEPVAQVVGGAVGVDVLAELIRVGGPHGHVAVVIPMTVLQLAVVALGVV